MAEPGAKRVRKNRTLAARIEEIEEKFSRKPTEFELRALAELPLQKEPFDTSENGRRIHGLLELSERTRDVSYLQEAGELITFQATRNPYGIMDPEVEKEIEKEVEKVEVKHTASDTSYAKKAMCCSPSQWVRRPAPEPCLPGTTASSHTNIPRNIDPIQSAVSRPTNTLPPISNILSFGASYSQTPAPLPPLLPLRQINYPSQLQLPPVQNAATLNHQAGNILGRSQIGTHGVAPPGPVPNYSGWHPFQSTPYYPTTSPQAYSLSNGHANFNTLQILPHHTSGLPMSNRTGLNIPTGSQLRPVVLPNVQINSSSYRAVNVQSSSIPPINNTISNGFTDSNLPPVIRSGLQPNPYSSQTGGMQSSLAHLAGQALSSNSAAKFPPPLLLSNDQINLNSNSTEASQLFHIDPQDYAKSNDQSIQQSSTILLNDGSKLRNSQANGKKRGHDEFAEGGSAGGANGKEESSPKKRSRRD